MFYSYVMGIDRFIHTLEEQNFIIQNDGDNYTVIFPKEKASVWEKFITAHITQGYWNEYLANDRVIFLFHLADGIRRCEVKTMKMRKF